MTFSLGTYSENNANELSCHTPSTCLPALSSFPPFSYEIRKKYEGAGSFRFGGLISGCGGQFKLHMKNEVTAQKLKTPEHAASHSALE